MPLKSAQASIRQVLHSTFMFRSSADGPLQNRQPDVLLIPTAEIMVCLLYTSMGVLYYSTRGDKQAYTASQAILQGLAKDGGLFVPDALPKLDKTMEELSAMDYKAVAYEVMKQFLPDYTEEELKTCLLYTSYSRTAHRILTCTGLHICQICS